MSKLTTDDIIAIYENTVANYHAGRYPDMKWIDETVITATIAKLRAADALAEACGELVDALSYDTNEGEGLSSKQFDQRLHRAGCAILTYAEAGS
jgi:hypothetical protein